MTKATVGDEGFSGRRAAEIVGISYRQLDYWARTDLIRPSLTDAAGSGSRRSYSYRDLLELKLVKQLIDGGVDLKKIRKTFTFVREELGEDVSSANLVLSGNNIVISRNEEELFDAFRNGQGVLNVLPVGPVKDELDAKVLELRRADAEALDATADAI